MLRPSARSTRLYRRPAAERIGRVLDDLPKWVYRLYWMLVYY